MRTPVSIDPNYQSCKGQGMVEFLIILPVLLLLVMGILQFALIYQAKVTLNYAAFETARAGSLNNASMDKMKTAFARSMAPLYTNRHTDFNSGNCSNSFTLDSGNTSRKVLDTNYSAAAGGGGGTLNSDDFICAKRRVQQQIDDGYVNITVINPSPASFADFGVDKDSEIIIPNNNLMYRDATVESGSGQSIQDANLLKIHIGYCYELYVPFVNRLIWLMQRYGPGELSENTAMMARQRVGTAAPEDPGFFGPPKSGSFAHSCISNPKDSGRYSIVLYSQGIIRMQSDAIQSEVAGTP